MDLENIPENFAPAKEGITLYNMGTPNGVKITIALALLNIPYKMHKVSFKNNPFNEPWYREISPAGQIPAILDIDKKTGKVIKICQSGAILQYLADKYDTQNKISFARNTPEYYESLEWLHFQTSDFGVLFAQALFFILLSPEKIPYGIKRYTTATIKNFNILEKRLREQHSKNKEYLVGDHISISDIVSVGSVMFSWVFRLDMPKQYPELTRWVENLLQIPEVVKGLNATGLYLGFSKGPWKVPEKIQSSM